MNNYHHIISGFHGEAWAAGAVVGQCIKRSQAHARSEREFLKEAFHSFTK